MPDTPANLPTVQGHCPACGWTTLFLADGGYPTCSRLECPDPDAASVLLERDPRHGHRYLSTGCLHGDQILPDGRTGHQYCQADTGHAGSKKPGRCKFCSVPCICPCHRKGDLA